MCACVCVRACMCMHACLCMSVCVLPSVCIHTFSMLPMNIHYYITLTYKEVNIQQKDINNRSHSNDTGRIILLNAILSLLNLSWLDKLQ